MTTFNNIANILNARGMNYATPANVEAECTDYDGWDVSKTEQDAWLAETSDEVIADWAMSALDERFSRENNAEIA